MHQPYTFLKISVFLILFTLLGSCQKADTEAKGFSSVDTGYYSLEEYLEKYDGETERYEAFRESVHEPGVPSDAIKQLKPVIIAMIYPGADRSDYWVRSVSSFSSRMDELNISFELNEFFSLPGTIDQDIQESQINEALEKDPDYLVFTLDLQRHKELIEQIITIGRPKIILQNITTPLKEWEENQPFLYVGFSHNLGTTTILGPEYLNRVGTEGSYGMLYFGRGFVSEQRGDSFIQYMRDNSNIKLKSAFYTDGQFEKSKTATEQLIIENPQIDFIYACSTTIALAAVEVLEERGLKDRILVNGWGGGSAELDSIAQGKLDFTVMRMNDDNGVAMAEAIKLDLLDKTEKVPTVYSGNFVLVTQETDSEMLTTLKKRAFRYSGNDE